MPQELRTDLDVKRNQLLNRIIERLAAPPASPEEGLEYFDTTLKTVGVWNGSGWLYSGTGASAPHFATFFGDGFVRSYTINHGLNSMNVIAQVSLVSDRSVIMCDISYPDANHVTLGFAKAPDSNELKVVVV